VVLCVTAIKPDTKGWIRDAGLAELVTDPLIAVQVGAINPATRTPKQCLSWCSAGFGAGRPNELWSGDVLRGPKVAGRKTYVSRYAHADEVLLARSTPVPPRSSFGSPMADYACYRLQSDGRRLATFGRDIPNGRIACRLGADVEILAAGVVIVGVIAVLNLLLTFGVIRRLREHTDLLASGAGASRGVPTMIGVGESIAPFRTTGVDGSLVSSDRFGGPTLVGVFAPGCEACEEKLPVFVKHASSFPGGRENVLALVVASDDVEAAPYVDVLVDVAVIVQESQNGPISEALSITGYPVFAYMEGGVVRASALDPTRLPAQVLSR
jgi:thiol-disulfide isomerase/thioredoxin